MKKFSDTADSDAQGVMNVAKMLHISEFEVFRLAYRNWFGHSAPRREIESFFHQYLNEAVVPMWVRDFTRRIQQLHRENRLDTREFDIEQPAPNSYWTAFLGGMAFAFILMLVSLLIYLAIWTENASLVGCNFPPCY